MIDATGAGTGVKERVDEQGCASAGNEIEVSVVQEVDDILRKERRQEGRKEGGKKEGKKKGRKEGRKKKHAVINVKPSRWCVGYPITMTLT